MSVAKITEITAASPKGFEDAIRVGLKRAGGQIRPQAIGVDPEVERVVALPPWPRFVAPAKGAGTHQDCRALGKGRVDPFDPPW